METPNPRQRDLQVALVRNDIAHQSVQALLDDLDHVIALQDPGEQVQAATAVLAHHDPAVDEGLLSHEGRQLQRSARWTLRELTQHRVEAAPPHVVSDKPTGEEPAIATRASRARKGAAVVAATAGFGFGLGSLIQQFL